MHNLLPTIQTIKNIVGTPSEFGLGWIMLLLSALVTLWIIPLKIIHYSQKKKDLYKKLSSLAPETNIQYFKDKLECSPTFINETGGYKEFIFTNNKFYVQAITDKIGKVLMFSITTTDKKFNPTFFLNTQGKPLKFELGKTKFSDLDALGAHIEISFLSGANWGYYSEFHQPWAKISAGQTYGFGVNESGFNDYFTSPLREGYSDEDLKVYRSNTIANTYAVFGPSGYILNKEFLKNKKPLGADSYQTKILL